MERNHFLTLSVVASLCLGACGNTGAERENVASAGSELQLVPAGTDNIHLQPTAIFSQVQPGSDADQGRALFGLAPDMNTEDPTQAIFQGPSQAFGGVVESNNRTCFTCHRGTDLQLGLPAGPLSATIPLTDTLFTGLHADAQQDPDGMTNLDQLGLVKYRPNRFNLARDQADPYRKVFFWRKSIKLVNSGFSRGFLNDGRARVLFETARGAVFSHTQESDSRFDDLFTVQNGNDMEAFLLTRTLSQPELAALRDPSDPLYQTLLNDPFYTVPIQTQAQKRGSKVFAKYCMTCHNTPNVFNNLMNVEPLGSSRPVTDPAFAPNVGKLFNIGVSERNKHHLRFTVPTPTGGFETVILPLTNEDGSVDNYPVTIDIGMAATTGRRQDVGRFKVPQLRNLKALAPYFHDNSAATIEELVDYFNGPFYNHSRDGKRFPIHLSSSKRADLIEFLKIL
jgi:hypothetical protein